MKIKVTRTVTVHLTVSDVQQAVVDYLPKRFTGVVFMARMNVDGTADLESKEPAK